MLWLESHIADIEEHIAAGSAARLTYAALECRIALELVCYERLRVSYYYLSESDFVRRWTPRHVIDFLIAEGNDNATQEFTLSIGKDPVEPKEFVRHEDFEGVEWLPVGTQVGFDSKKIGKLWQALSSFLHVKLPRSKDDRLDAYGDVVIISSKLEEVLGELRRLSQGTLISSGLGETVSFECRCGMTNKRRTKLVTEGSVLNCSNPDCLERYRVHVEDNDDISFERVTLQVACRACGDVGHFPEQAIINIGLNKTVKYACSVCGELNYISWRLMQAAKKEDT